MPQRSSAGVQARQSRRESIRTNGRCIACGLLPLAERIYRQKNNITTYNLARMNMLPHGMKDIEFEIYHGDTLKNE